MRDDLDRYFRSPVDFLDFGCSKGGSISYAMRRFEARRGVGIDLDESKVIQTRAAGFEAVQADVLDLRRLGKAVSFVTMIDFLEHLPSVRDAAKCVSIASHVSKDFIYIRQPWFDADGYLFSRGLKLFWSDWGGHPNTMTSLALYLIVSRLSEVADFRIYGYGPIFNSGDDCVLSASSPIDQHGWDVEKHSSKPVVNFDIPVFRQIVCLATMRNSSRDICDLERRVKVDTLIFDSRGK